MYASGTQLDKYSPTAAAGSTNTEFILHVWKGNEKMTNCWQKINGTLSLKPQTIGGAVHLRCCSACICCGATVPLREEPQTFFFGLMLFHGSSADLPLGWSFREALAFLALGQPFPLQPQPKQHQDQELWIAQTGCGWLEEVSLGCFQGICSRQLCKDPTLGRIPNFHWESFGVLQITVNSSHCFRAALTVLQNTLNSISSFFPLQNVENSHSFDATSWIAISHRPKQALSLQ